MRADYIRFARAEVNVRRELGWVEAARASGNGKMAVLFRFLLPKADHSFFRALRAALDREQVLRREDRILISVTEIPALDPEDA